jgi:protocatechuate 3,4-dioxygenase beta subunit
MLGAGAAGLVGAARPFAATVSSCAVTPQQTEGPYYVDERLARSDIRSDPADRTLRDGVPLHLTLTVSRAGKGGCGPAANVLVDIWHCDAAGLYSDQHDTFLGYNTLGKKFLRGYQLTDAEGIVRFTTIYPGWYSDRAVHMHVKIRTNAKGTRGSEFTSQLYFDDAITDRVHARDPYNRKTWPRVRNDADRIYRAGGDRLRLRLAPDGAGYRGTFDIALQS